jgi:hypothetical protein
VDHEVSRRRECTLAVGNLWAAILSMVIEFSSFTDYLDNLPVHFVGSQVRDDGVPPDQAEAPLIYDLRLW